jgi:hypothetical protein
MARKVLHNMVACSVKAHSTVHSVSGLDSGLTQAFMLNRLDGFSVQYFAAIASL